MGRSRLCGRWMTRESRSDEGGGGRIRTPGTDLPRSTGFGSHGDYMFGWKGDSLQRAMDSPCYVNCPTLKTQSISEMNKCAVPNTVDENFDGCE